MGFVRLATAALLLAAGFAVAVATTRGAAAGGATPTIAVDTTFNGGNPLLLTFPTPSGGSGPPFMSATAVARQSDGKVVVGGYDQVGSVADFDVARLNADGTLDTSFGANGYVDLTPIPGDLNFIEGIAIQPDGRIVVAGTANFSEIAIARLTTTGSLDTTFAPGGGTPGILLDSSAQVAYGVAVDGNGNIDVPTSRGGVNRYTSTGAADTNFNGTGQSPAVMTSASALVIQPDGKIVVAGYFNQGGLPPSHGAVARLNSDGTVDTSFAAGTGSDCGSGCADITPGGGNEQLNSVALEDSNIVVGGETNQGNGSVLARLTSAGALDTTFGTGGRISETTSGGQISAVFYSPHPVLVKVVNDSDENQGDTPDDQDSGTCIADGTDGRDIACQPSGDVETGSAQAGAQTVGANGSTVDTAGSTPDGSHVTVSQVHTSDGNSETVTITSTTIPNCPPPGSPAGTPCDDFVMLDYFQLYVDIDVFGGHEAFSAHDNAVVPEQDEVDIAIKVRNNGPDAADCYAYLQGEGSGLGNETICETPVVPGTERKLWFPQSGSVNAGVTHVHLYSHVTGDGYDPVADDPTIGDDSRLFEVRVATPPTGTPVLDSATADGASGGVKDTRSPSSRVAAAPITHVDVAIMEVPDKSSCRWVSSPSGHLGPKRPSNACGAPVWLRAKGTNHWTLRLKHKLGPGRYAFLARAVDKKGRASSGFSIARHTIKTLVVR